MNYVYFISSDIRRKLTKMNLGDSFENRLKAFEVSNKELKSDTALKRNWLVKKYNAKTRPTFIFFRKYFEDKLCMYILRWADVHDKYEREINEGTLEKWTQANLPSVQEEEEIESFYQKLVNEGDGALLKQKPELTSTEKDFITKQIHVNHRLKDEAIVFETRTWVEQISAEDDSFSFVTRDILEYIIEHLNDENGWGTIKLQNDQFVHLYHNENKWILTELNKDSAKKNEEPPTEYLRGYPYTMLSNPVKWIAMEKNAKSNIALTEEQIECVSSEQLNYPMFITGRAGSGKSTVLQYLFTEILTRWYRIIYQTNSNLQNPLYLSYSKELINEAKTMMEDLFEYNNCIKDLKIDYAHDIKPYENKIFQTFENIRDACILKHDPSLLHTRFSPDKKISFRQFKSMWYEKYGKDRSMLKNCGANISWHVIRTYIKGWDSDSYMPPEDYADKDYIGQKHRTVRNETFELVYNKVWLGWYKQLTESERWDDLDVVRYLLDHDYVDGDFSAIYCDEAQDFTRTEIDFILKLSCFSNRTLDKVDLLYKLPFVFAGDEFQTLSPTGFSWESIRGYFADRIFSLTGLENHFENKALPKTIEFVKNYRSTPQIVKVANRMQLLRAARFNEYSNPQEPHFKTVDADVYCVSPNSDIKMWEQIKDNNVYLIVPKDEGESVKQYIERTPLSNFITYNEKSGQAKIKHYSSSNDSGYSIKILSTSVAKGGEYANVLVYGFGLDDNFSELTSNNLRQWFDNPKDDIDKDIELKYQICNAYVALTRATKRLYIIDDFTPNSFWSFLLYSMTNEEIRMTNELLENQMLNRISTKKVNWANPELLGWIREYKKTQMTFVTQTPAQKLDEINKLRNNPDIDSDTLRQLAFDYKKFGMMEDFYLCQADAYYLEEKYEDAAALYLEAKNTNKYVDCYWHLLTISNNVAGLIDKIGQVNDRIEDIRTFWCNKLNHTLYPADLKKLLNDIVIQLESDTSNITPWKKILNFAFPLIEITKGAVSSIKQIIATNLKLSNYGITIENRDLALFAYKCDAIDDALVIWESMQRTLRPTIYYEYKWNNIDYPQKIEYAKDTKDPHWYDKVVSEYRFHKDLKLEKEHLKILLDAIRLGNYIEEYKNLFPYMLATVDSYDDISILLNEAKQFNIFVQDEAVDVLGRVKFNKFNEWRFYPSEYNTDEYLYFMAAVDSIKYIKQPDYNEIISNKYKSGYETYDIVREFDNHKNKAYSLLFFSELGKAFEKRNKYTDILSYYEAAEKMSDNFIFKKYMDTRWIVYKELQANYEQSQGNIKNYERYKNSALKMREKWDYAPNDNLDEYDLTIDDWTSFFIYAINIKKFIDKQSQSSTDIIEVVNPKINIVNNENNSLNQLVLLKQDYSYGNYLISYSKEKNYVIIRDEERQLKIQNGQFKSHDFYLENNKLFETDSDKLTPFEIEIDNIKIIIRIMDSEISDPLIFIL